MEDKIKEIIKEDIEKEGFEIVEIKCSEFKGRTNLKIFIDKPGGITLSDCEKSSGIIEFLLDGSNLSLAEYDMEVSSPGLNRLLISEKDFKRHLGKIVMVNLREAVGNIKNYIEGKIVSVDNGKIVVENKNSKIEIPVEKIARAKLKIEI